MSLQISMSRDHARLIRQLETISFVSQPARMALASLPMRIRAVGEDRDIVRQGETPTESCLILEGFVCRYKMIGGGKRQILSFHFPGDMPDLQSLQLGTMDHGISALTPTRVAFIPHEAIRALGRAQPELADLLTRHAMIDASIFREWIANVGRRTAYERVAHVFCEVYTRMRALGLLKEASFELPVTQAELGDATGLSTVHINRTMQELRRNGLLTSQGRTHSIGNWEGLQHAADFDPAYLHMRPVMEAAL